MQIAHRRHAHCVLTELMYKRIPCIFFCICFIKHAQIARFTDEKKPRCKFGYLFDHKITAFIISDQLCRIKRMKSSLVSVSCNERRPGCHHTGCRCLLLSYNEQNVGYKPVNEWSNKFKFTPQVPF